MSTATLSRHSGHTQEVRDAGQVPGLLAGLTGLAGFAGLVRRGRAALAGAPGTLAYLLALAVTWTTLQGTSPRLGHRLIVTASTNLANMTHSPLRVLFASAFWLDGSGFPWLTVLEFLLVMVAVERYLGTARWLTVFAAGHVGATLATVAGIAWAVHHHLLPASLARTTDVGTSYGFFAVAAAGCYAIGQPRLRRVVMAALGGYLLIALVRDGSFTAYGHLIALGIGLLLGRALRPRRSVARCATPQGPSWWRQLPAGTSGPATRFAPSAWN